MKAETFPAVHQADLAQASGRRGGGIIGGSMPPRSYTELSYCFGALEHYFAQSCGNDEAGNLLRRARMSFIRDFAPKPRRQADMREFAQA